VVDGETRHTGRQGVRLRPRSHVEMRAIVAKERL
jgi:hypothetical protein